MAREVLMSSGASAMLSWDTARNLGPRASRSFFAITIAVMGGCGSQLETQSRADLDRVQTQLGRQHSTDSDEHGSAHDPEQRLGTLRSYVASAFAHSPELRAAYEEWRAALEGPRQARKFPELVLTYGGFIRSVETRVGPQRHRLGALQWFPWPTRLNAGRDAAVHSATSAQKRFEALALEVAAQVAHAYWRLWFVQKNQLVQEAQRDVLISLSRQVRARLEAGKTGLSDLAQVDLSISRTSDVIAGLEEAERSATAELIRAIGAERGTPTPIEPEQDPPVALLPESDDTELRDAAVAHPRVAAMASMSLAAEERARAAKGQRGPSIGLGLDWIVTGPAVDPSIPDSGQDAVVGMVGIKIPVSGGAYKAERQQALAEGAMFRARERAARDRAVAELEQALANLRDAVRRVQLYETTLVPQAETTYSSTLDGYQSGRASLAEVLLAEKDLLELALGLFRAQASYGASWAELERVVGHPVPTRSDEGDMVP